MIKLIDVNYTTTEDVEFGTCELCFYTGDLHQTFLVFQDDKTNEILEIETGYWDYGEYETFIHIDNIIRFADFIREKNIKTLKEVDENIINLVDEYNNKYKEEIDVY